MSHSKNNTAKLLTLAITITLLGGLPLMAQDGQVTVLDSDDRYTQDNDARLLSTAPQLGKQVTLAATRLPDGLAWFFFSPAPDEFASIGHSRTVYIDLDNYASVGGYRVERDGCVVVATTLPEIPQLRGVEISVQAVGVGEKGGVELTNGLLWTMGY